MDQARFDALARALTSRLSRRATVAAALGLASAAPAAAKRKPRVVALGGRCQPSDRCREGSCLRNVCACGGSERRCGRQCIPTDSCCVDDECQRAPNGSPCSRPKCMANGSCGFAPLPAGTPCGTGDTEICEGSGRCVARRCASDAECPSVSGYCRSVACRDGLCTATPRTFGTPLPVQVPGDCLTTVCDGAGNTTAIPDELDIPANANPCIAALCDHGVVVRTNRPAGTPCGTGRTCNGSGICS